MPIKTSAARSCNIVDAMILALVHRLSSDLSTRQFGIFLTCYLTPGTQTARGLAADLNMSLSATLRALKRLSGGNLLRYVTDPADRDDSLVLRTATGMTFLQQINMVLQDALGELDGVPADRPARNLASATPSVH